MPTGNSGHGETFRRRCPRGIQGMERLPGEDAHGEFGSDHAADSLPQEREGRKDA